MITDVLIGDGILSQTEICGTIRRELKPTRWHLTIFS